ncbi:MAG: hypothetical protein FWG53_03745 [Clostridiales bacterium]|nr:hypothetical protein [Clostridiales bacterium]
MNYTFNNFFNKFSFSKEISQNSEIFIENANNVNFKRRALLYYKTDPFLHPELVSAYSHPNNWRIVELVRLLDLLGFTVDVLDRKAEEFDFKNTYDLFLGLGSGGSGRNLAKYAMHFPNAIKILYATTAEPKLSDAAAMSRYEYFERRHGPVARKMRLNQLDFDSFIQIADYIFAIGEKGSFCPSSYEKFGKPVLQWYPNTSPVITPRLNNAKNYVSTNFICLLGDGIIYKGVDLIIDSFINMPEFRLSVCCSRSDTDFFHYYDDIINKTNNITFHGFIDIKSDFFKELCNDNPFSILCSASEGCCTSVATLMRAGVVPIINHSTGIDTCGAPIINTVPVERLTDEIERACRAAASLTFEEYTELAYKTYYSSLKYTQTSFSTTILAALNRVLSEKFQ